MNMKMIIKTDIELENGAICDCFCCNGFAFAVEQSKEERKFCYYLNYPTLEEVEHNDDMCKEIISYCGFNDINFGDIMLTYGQVNKPIKENLIKVLDAMANKLKEDNLSEKQNELINMAYKNIGCVIFGMNI